MTDQPINVPAISAIPRTGGGQEHAAQGDGARQQQRYAIQKRVAHCGVQRLGWWHQPGKKKGNKTEGQ